MVFHKYCQLTRFFSHVRVTLTIGIRHFLRYCVLAAADNRNSVIVEWQAYTCVTGEVLIWRMFIEALFPADLLLEVMQKNIREQLLEKVLNQAVRLRSKIFRL